MAGLALTTSVLVAWIACVAVHAQQPGTPERPGLQGDRLQPSEVGRETGRRVLFELRLAESQPVRGLAFEATIQGTGRKLYLHYTTVVTNGDISRARLIENGGRYEVGLRFTDEGAAKLTAATTRHLGRPVAIVLDGEVVADLVVRMPLAAELVLSANLTRADAIRIVDGLNRW